MKGLWQRAAYHLSQGVDIVGEVRHDSTMGVGVEEGYWQLLHVAEHVAPQPEHGALTHTYHQSVVGVRASHAHQ